MRTTDACTDRPGAPRTGPIGLRLAALLLACLMLALSGSASAAKWEPNLITDVNDLEGRRVGVNLAWEPDYYLTGRDDLVLVRYDTLADMILALRFNKIDAFATDRLLVQMLLAASDGLTAIEPPFGEVNYTLFFKPKSDALLGEFNAFLAAYRQSEAFEDHIARLEAFDGTDYDGPDIPLTGTGPVLRVAIDAEGFPRSFPDTDEDVPIGFDLEALKAFANERDYRLEFAVSNYEDIVFGLKSGIYDIGAGYLSDIFKNEVSAAGILLSDPLDSTSLYFIQKAQQNIRVAMEELE